MPVYSLALMGALPHSSFPGGCFHVSTFLMQNLAGGDLTAKVSAASTSWQKTVKATTEAGVFF